MKFLGKINNLDKEYSKESCGTRDNARLYGVYDSAPPLAKHIVFSSMPEDVMWNMVRNYKRPFPKELLTLFRSINGAYLFWTVRVVGDQKTRIPYSCFSIYGIPLTYDRKHIEPCNISIEDLDRPEGVPDSWLKFGTYYQPNTALNRYDLYVDTNGTGVYAVGHKSPTCNIWKKWAMLDDCLCDIFDLLITQ